MCVRLSFAAVFVLHRLSFNVEIIAFVDTHCCDIHTDHVDFFIAREFFIILRTWLLQRRLRGAEATRERHGVTHNELCLMQARVDFDLVDLYVLSKGIFPWH